MNFKQHSAFCTLGAAAACVASSHPPRTPRMRRGLRFGRCGALPAVLVSHPLAVLTPYPSLSTAPRGRALVACAKGRSEGGSTQGATDGNGA